MGMLVVACCVDSRKRPLGCTCSLKPLETSRDFPEKAVPMKMMTLNIKESPLGDSQAKLATLRSRQLKVLVLGEEVSYPPDTGRRIRTWNLMRRLAKRHSITYLCYGQSNDPAAVELASAGISVHLVPPLRALRGWSLYCRLIANLFSPYPYSVTKHFSRRFNRKLRRMLRDERFDLVHCEGTHCARFLKAVVSVPRVLGTHNIESQIWFRRAILARSWIEQIFFRMQAIKMRWFERRALLQAETAIAVTPHDLRQMRDWGVTEMSVVPNGVDLEAYGASSETERQSEILFLASLDWYPNVDALRYFLAEILPLILTVKSATMVRVVGRRPPKSLKKLVSGNSHVDLIGEVSDVRPHLAQAEVVVVPLRIGGGSRLKILEALAAGKAVVSTSVGAEGLGLTPGEHFQLADNPFDFAQRTITLMSSREARRRLGENGRRLVVEQYGWNEIAAKLEAAWFKAVARVPAGDFDPMVRDHVQVAP